MHVATADAGQSDLDHGAGGAGFWLSYVDDIELSETGDNAASQAVGLPSQAHLAQTGLVATAVVTHEEPSLS